MAEPRDTRPAAETQRQASNSDLDKHARTIRERDAVGGVVEAPEPQHGDPASATPPAAGESVIGVRVGSEASVESGTGPVLAAGGPGLTAFTRVRNRDLRERDEKEFKRRGLKSDGGAVAARDISASSEGVFVVQRVGDDERSLREQLVNGSYTGPLPAEGLLIRPLSAEEEAELFPAGNSRGDRRANDLVAGSGAGGGGNPMHRGDARGVTSATARGVGEGGVTSKQGESPPSRNTGPQGGGTTSRG